MRVPTYGSRTSGSGRKFGRVILRDAVTGRRQEIMLGDYGTPESLAAYGRTIAEWRARGGRLSQPEAPGVTCGEIARAYAEWSATQPYSTSHRTWLRIISQLLESSSDALPVSGFGPLALAQIRDGLLTPTDARRAWKRSSASRAASAIIGIFRWAAGRQMIPATMLPALEALPPLHRSERGRVTSAPLADVQAIQPFVSRQVWAMIQVQLLTGIRPGEVVQMRTCDLDRSGEIWLYRPQEHKREFAGEEATRPIGPRAQEVLRPWLRLEITRPLFSPAEAVAEWLTTRRDDGNLSGSLRLRYVREEFGSAYTVASYRRAITRACDRAGVKRWHPHQLRHTRATEIERQYGIETARAALGHKSIKVTEIYVDRDQQVAQRVAAEIG